ncbi:MAG: A/G-specific adenine glycosylase [Polyangiaceae bacterium]|jgi:A/G-specific adenine glycosylase|nr:A/G-specific adenine glycosylase [Polyangiaceae bacterium]
MNLSDCGQRRSPPPEAPVGSCAKPGRRRALAERPAIMPEVPQRANVRARLLAWFDTQARALPWRESPRDPYAVWISEVMLQQTRVSAVVPYYLGFLHRFPSVNDLAHAQLDQVLSAWSGLGYYRRGRALHEAARAIVDRHGGSVPSDVRLLRALPGIGPYTSAAIASIAFGEPVAVVDGNVRRVVSRLLAIEQPVDSTQGKKTIQQIAQAILDPERPGPFNEAMMDLGATVCTPKRPACRQCPLDGLCRAHQTGIQESLPVLARRAESPRVCLTCVVAHHGEQVLLGRRHNAGLFGGLWEPLLFADGEQRALAVVRDVWPHTRAHPAGEIEHVLTHRVLVVRLWDVGVSTTATFPVAALPAAYEQVAWLSPKQWETLGMSALARRILDAAERWRADAT